eukprot:6236738-Amphidinium_carterae.3
MDSYVHVNRSQPLRAVTMALPSPRVNCNSLHKPQMFVFWRFGVLLVTPFLKVPKMKTVASMVLLQLQLLQIQYGGAPLSCICLFVLTSGGSSCMPGCCCGQQVFLHEVSSECEMAGDV